MDISNTQGITSLTINSIIIKRLFNFPIFSSKSFVLIDQIFLGKILKFILKVIQKKKPLNAFL